MGKSPKPTGFMSFVSVVGAAVTGAAMGAVATLLSDQKNRKSLEKSAEKVVSQVKKKLSTTKSKSKTTKK